MVSSLILYDTKAIFELNGQMVVLSAPQDLESLVHDLQGVVEIHYARSDAKVEVKPCPQLPWLDRLIFLRTQRRVAQQDTHWQTHIDVLKIKGEWWVRQIKWPRHTIEQWEDRVLSSPNVVGVLKTKLMASLRNRVQDNATLIYDNSIPAMLYVDGTLVWLGLVSQEDFYSKNYKQHMQRLFPQWLGGEVQIRINKGTYQKSTLRWWQALKSWGVGVYRGVAAGLMVLLLGLNGWQGWAIFEGKNQVTLLAQQSEALRHAQSERERVRNVFSPQDLAYIMKRVAFPPFYAEWISKLPEHFADAFQGYVVKLACEPKPYIQLEGVLLHDEPQQFVDQLKENFIQYRVSFKSGKGDFSQPAVLLLEESE